MSKAFTKDDAAEEPFFVSARPPLPAGVPNYVTPRGLALLRAELDRLRLVRATLESTSGDTERAHTLAAASAHLAELEDRIACAQVVTATDGVQEVRFGTRVTVRTDTGAEKTIEIVGVDEADAERGLLAFVAPLARALLGKRVGDEVTVRRPRGEEQLEVIAVRER